MKNTPIFRPSNAEKARRQLKKGDGPDEEVLSPDSDKRDTLIYFFGRSDEDNIKFGKSGSITGGKRRQAEHTKEVAKFGYNYDTVLALLWGDTRAEDRLKNYWKKKGLIISGTNEFIRTTDDVRAYIKFLRGKHYTATDWNELKKMRYVDCDEWCPESNEGEERRIRQKSLLRMDFSPWADVLASVQTNGEFYTNRNIIELAHATMGSIDLDPASCKKANTIVKAKKIFTINDKQEPWYGNVWINPPFGEWDKWGPRIRDSIKHKHIGQICVFVTASASTSDQFQREVGRYMSAHCVAGGRRDSRCWGPGTTAKGAGEGNMVYYFGGRVEQFVKEFSKMGTVWVNSTSPPWAAPC